MAADATTVSCKVVQRELTMAVRCGKVDKGIKMKSIPKKTL